MAISPQSLTRYSAVSKVVSSVRAIAYSPSASGVKDQAWSLFAPPLPENVPGHSPEA